MFVSASCATRYTASPASDGSSYAWPDTVNWHGTPLTSWNCAARPARRSGPGSSSSRSIPIARRASSSPDLPRWWARSMIPGSRGSPGSSAASIRAPSSWSMSPDREWASTSCISLASRWRSASPAARACAARVPSSSIRSRSAWSLACPSRLASNVMPGKPTIAMALSSASVGESWLTATATAARHVMPTIDNAIGKRSGTRGASSTRPAKSPARPAPSGLQSHQRCRAGHQHDGEDDADCRAPVTGRQRAQRAQREPAHGENGRHVAARQPRVPAAGERDRHHHDKKRRSEAAHPPEGRLLLRPRHAQRGEGRAGRGVCAHPTNTTARQRPGGTIPGGRAGLTQGRYASTLG